MKILLVCREFPYPPHDGYSLFTYNIMRQLSKDHSIDLLCLTSRETHLLETEPIEPIVNTTTIVKQQGLSGISRALGILFSRLTILPSDVNRIRRTTLDKAISDRLEEEDYSIVYLNSPELAWYAPQVFPRLATVVAPLDSRSRQLKELQNTIRNPLLYLWSLEQQYKHKRFESRHYRFVDACIVVSSRDKAHLDAIDKLIETAIVPLGVDSEIYSPREHEHFRYDLVFSGNLDYDPNHHAALILVKKVMPELRKALPQVRLGLIGKDPRRELRKAVKGDENIVVTGYVDDIASHISSGKVYVSPVEYGTGMRVKTLEAMSIGMPIVTYQKNIEDIPAQQGKHVLVASNIQEFIRQTIYLLMNENIREDLGREARELILNHFSWDIIAGQMNDLLEAALHCARKRIGAV